MNIETDEMEPTAEEFAEEAIFQARAAIRELREAQERKAPIWVIRALQEILDDALEEAERQGVRHRI